MRLLYLKKYVSRGRCVFSIMLGIFYIFIIIELLLIMYDKIRPNLHYMQL